LPETCYQDWLDKDDELLFRAHLKRRRTFLTTRALLTKHGMW
jgi:hypothetical protein